MNQVDTDLFYWINSHHTSWLDWVMWIASQGWSWGIVIAAAIIHMVTKADSRRWASLGWIVAGVGLCFLLSDRISVLCFKDVFCRLRPCHALENVRMFRTSCGGLYGFVSSHAANVFSLALFLSLYHAKKASVHPKSSIFTFHLSPFTFHFSSGPALWAIPVLTSASTIQAMSSAVPCSGWQWERWFSSSSNTLRNGSIDLSNKKNSPGNETKSLFLRILQRAYLFQRCI